MLQLKKDYPQKISDLLERFKIKDATLEMMNLARAANKYFNDSEPWKTVKTDKEKCGTTINISLQIAYTLAEMLSPVIPFTSEKIFKMLNADKNSWFESGGENLKEGHEINKPEILFVKIDDEIIEKHISSLPTESEEKSVLKIAEITYEDFSKISLKVAEILEAEKVPKSKKLLKLKVNLGSEQRQVIAGIAAFYEPEDLIGKKIVMVANLKPVKLFGLESQGMILASEDSDGNLNIVEVNSSVKVGSKVK
ncbi:methionine--tRNA ligase [bacterium BMS3Abin04]|nr:methionine--tRNA ligase [bacterium BMS3Abin04]